MSSILGALLVLVSIVYINFILRSAHNLKKEKQHIDDLIMKRAKQESRIHNYIAQKSVYEIKKSVIERKMKMANDKEWLKEEIKKNAKKYPTYHDERDGLIKMMVSFHDVMALIDQLEEPQQEKVVVPQFVADYIDENKGHDKGQFIYNSIVNSELFEQGNVSENMIPSNISNYIQSEKTETFIKAVYGYEVEKEKRYTACFAPIGTRQGVYLYRESGSVKVGDDMVVYEKNNPIYHLTEQEIRSRDERFWVFAEEVTE